MRMPMKLMPDKIIDKYNLNRFEHDGWVYIKILKGMYGLPQAGKIANELLQKRLKMYRYHPDQLTPGLWIHVWRLVKFTLVVDEFGVKFEGLKHANHLKTALERWYDITVDWDGSKYVGINLKWDYDKRKLDTSIPGYVDSKLDQFGHKPPAKPQHLPAIAQPIKYGQKIQKATPIDISAKLSKEGIERIQKMQAPLLGMQELRIPQCQKP